jgi:hypothetical protein
VAAQGQLKHGSRGVISLVATLVLAAWRQREQQRGGGSVVGGRDDNNYKNEGNGGGGNSGGIAATAEARLQQHCQLGVSASVGSTVAEVAAARRWRRHNLPRLIYGICGGKKTSPFIFGQNITCIARKSMHLMILSAINVIHWDLGNLSALCKGSPGTS